MQISIELKSIHILIEKTVSQRFESSSNSERTHFVRELLEKKLRFVDDELTRYRSSAQEDSKRLELKDQEIRRLIERLEAVADEERRKSREIE